MKKRLITAVTAALLLMGCGSEPADTKPGPDTEPISGDLYSRYTSAVENRPAADSSTAAISTKYTYLFSDGTNGIYQMDGILEQDEERIHITQHLNANGMASEIDGYYDGSRLYNTFNGIHYYEDMTPKDVRDSMLMPLEPFVFPQDYVQGLAESKDAEGNTLYSLAIAEDRLADVFKDRYDFNDMDQLDECKVTSGVITDTFSEEGYFLKETSRFEVTFVYSGQEIKTIYDGSVNYVGYNETEVVITDAQREEFSQYVVYTDIDTSQIDTEPVADDTPEATASATFRKRLVNRLGYEEESPGVFVQSYNQNEAYTIDFNNHTFKYSNRTINYVYNWDGDIGTMGKCTLNFETSASASDCTEETLDMIRKVKGFLQMELYYCGPSLEELQAEN